MKFLLTKGETSVILTVFIQDSSATNGDGLGSLDQTSSITGGYLKRNGTGVALAVDENVSTEGTYEAPSTAAQVRIGTPANMITGTYELHFHNDLFTTADWVTITLHGATDMAPLTLEIQLGVNWIDSNNRVDVGSWLGAAAATPTVAGVPEVDQTHILGVAVKLFSQYSGSDGPGIFIDSNAANTNTELGVDGTEDTPVSTFVAARTLADALGVKVYYLEGNSDITLAATHIDWEFIGVGSVMDNVVNLGSQDVSRSLFRNLSLEGTQGGSGRITARDCALQDPGAGTSTFHIFAERCGFVDEFLVDTSNDNVFDACYSLVAGTATPLVTATGASGTIIFSHHSGGIELKSLSASHNITFEGIGKIIFNADCNVNANVSLRGIGSITDNTAGMASLVESSFMNMTKIEARTILAAAYFDPVADAVANVTLVAVTTTNTDMRGTNSAVLATTVGVAGLGLTDLGGMSTGMKAEIEKEVDDGLIAKGLDHLVFTSVIGADIADDSIIAQLVSKEVVADWDDFVNTTDSLQAIKDLGDVAWITATGFSTHTAENVRTEMDANSTKLTAIVADTNELQTDWKNTGRLDSILDNIELIVGTNGVVISSAVRNSIATSLLDLANGIETGVTLRQAQRGQLSAALGKLSGAATNNVLIRDVGDSKNRINATVDPDGNRSAVTLDLT